MRRTYSSIIEADKEFFALKIALYCNRQSAFKSLKTHKKELLGGIFTQVASQVCGAQYVLYESNLVMDACGMSRATQTWTLFICMLVAFGVEMTIVDKTGPKKLCVISLFALAVSQVALGFLFGLHPTKETNRIAVLGLIFCTSVYGPGIGTAPLIIGVESFPVNLMHFGGALVALTKYTINCLFVLFLFDVAVKLGPSKSFYIFGLLSLAGLVLISLFVPSFHKGQENLTGRMRPRHYRSASCFF